nr:zinc finger, CCHC-type [Tanacetum cinerariifolium]
MHPGKSHYEHIDKFHNLIGDLAAIDAAILDEDHVLLLLTYLPSSYDNFVETLLYGRDTLKLEYSYENLKRECPSADVMMAMSVKDVIDWIMDSRGSYHMTYMRDYLFDYEEYDSGNVLLEGFIAKIQLAKIKIMRGSLVVLSGTRRANCGSTKQCMKSEVSKHLGVAGIQQRHGLVEETNVTLLAKAVTRKTLKGRKQLGEYQTGWKIKTSNVLDSCNQGSTQQCMKIESGMSKVFWAEDTTMSTYLVNRSPSLAIKFKTPIDMLGFLGWLASIKQGMLEPVKVKCIFLGCCKVQVLQGVEFEIEPQDDHTFEVEPHGNVNHVAGLQEVQTQDMMDYHSACDREQHSTLTCEGNVLRIEIIRDYSGNTLRVSQSKVHNENSVQTLLEGHFILSLEGSLSEDHDVEKNGMCCKLGSYFAVREGYVYTKAVYMTLVEAKKEAIRRK